MSSRLLRPAGLLLGLLALSGAGWLLAGWLDADALRSVGAAVLGAPGPLLAALLAYALAFALRTLAWRRVLPSLPAGQAWAALHVALLGNHVLPLRLGEVLRVTSVLRRTTVPPASAVASTVALRGGDLATVLALAVVGAPVLLLPSGATLGGAIGALVVVAVVAVTAAGVAWLVRLRGQGHDVAVPGPVVVALTVAAWLLEATVVLAVAAVAGHPLTFGQAVAVTAVTVAVQAVAVTPGGFGTYEAAAGGALVAAGVPAGPAVAIALSTHLLKTAYALVLGLVALAVPAPAYWGRLRLPRRLPPRPLPLPVAVAAPVVALVPVHDEAATIAQVVRGLPLAVGPHPVRVLVVDDGSTDGSAELAAAAGATVVRQPRNLGLGAAVRRGLVEASALAPAAVVYLDADLEYDPAELPLLALPVLDGSADYVVGTRLAGRIERMLPHRRVGNVVLTAWVRWMTRRSDLTDGQSGYRAFSPAAAAAAEVVHDYNYAQVLTLDLLGKGFSYAEVPITYAFRRQGESFVRLGRYLRRVVPATYRELNQPG